MVKIYFIFPITGVKLDREFINELETTQSRCIIYTQFNFFFFCIFFFSLHSLDKKFRVLYILYTFSEIHNNYDNVINSRR